MPRRPRCILPGMPCHVTQRGVNRCPTFEASEDRLTYLRLLKDNLADAQAGLLAYCLMTNHVHLIVVPGHEESLAILLRRLHGRYAQYYNTRYGRSGHLWQNRYFACLLQQNHLWAAMIYVEHNPVRAGLAVSPADYAWSSAAAHLSGNDPAGILDMAWWLREKPEHWDLMLGTGSEGLGERFRRCTYAGRPFGDAEFSAKLAQHFGRHWTRGRPRKEQSFTASK